MRKTLILLLLLLTPTLALAEVDNPRCAPNPLFSSFPGSYIADCSQSRFIELELYKSMNPNEIFTKAGESWYYKYVTTPDATNRWPSPAEVRINFEKAIQQAKGKSRGTIIYVNKSDYFTITYQMTRPDGEYWGMIQADAATPTSLKAILHTMVRLAPMEESVVVTADEIAKSMEEEGKVVFYGIHFDTDKAVIKPESEPTLAEMAKWLKEHAGTKVYIVGHTDMQGEAGHNETLSQHRATAVVESLVKQHGIENTRLAARGVGPYAPVASNVGDKGRAQNRRVEMVLR